jgi:hypothetical protein
MFEVEKSEFPYLVDIGVTSICAKGCKYCYASANPDGKHADNYFLNSILLTDLLAANVFEVVLGGYGEPTLYQDGYKRGIECVISAYKDHNFKVGLTTSNYEWNHASNFNESVGKLDSLAISCNSLEDLHPAIELAKAVLHEPVLVDHRKPQVSIQTIAGILPWKDTMTILRTATASPNWIRNVTILGLHNCGRAKSLKGYKVPKGWMNQVRSIEDGRLNIGIDATMVNNWGDELLAAGVEPYRLSGAEGKQTCFVDAVSQTIKPSSYSDVSHPWLNDKFLEIFAKL